MAGPFVWPAKHGERREWNRDRKTGLHRSQLADLASALINTRLERMGGMGQSLNRFSSFLDPLKAIETAPAMAVHETIRRELQMVQPRPRVLSVHILHRSACSAGIWLWFLLLSPGAAENLRNGIKDTPRRFLPCTLLC